MTDQPLKRDVLIHYDEEKDEIAFYTLDVAATARARANSFDGARLPLAELRRQGADEAERTVGSGIFSLLDAFSIRKAASAITSRFPTRNISPMSRIWKSSPPTVTRTRSTTSPSS